MKMFQDVKMCKLCVIVHKRLYYLPEVVDLAVNQWLVLSLDVINVLDVAGVEVLLHHEAQEAVVWGVSCSKINE